jgi:5-formyltetrahydrofolate cyclo-ligase
VDTATYTACPIQDPASDLETGAFGIREPAARCAVEPLNKLDLILVPGVAFDLTGHRLGRGKGFYDQLLTAVRGKTCGIAFDQQIVREVPVEPHDKVLNCILTPTRWIEL